MKWSSLAVVLIVFATPLSARADLFSRLANRQAPESVLTSRSVAPAAATTESVDTSEASASPYHGGYHQGYAGHGHAWGHSTVLGGGCCLPESPLARSLWGDYCCGKYQKRGWLFAKHHHSSCCEPAHCGVWGHHQHHGDCCDPCGRRHSPFAGLFSWMHHKQGCCEPAGCGAWSHRKLHDGCCDPCGGKRHSLFASLFHWKHSKRGCCEPADCGCQGDSFCHHHGGEVWHGDPSHQGHEYYEQPGIENVGPPVPTGDDYTPTLDLDSTPNDENPVEEADERSAQRGRFLQNSRFMTFLQGL